MSAPEFRHLIVIASSAGGIPVLIKLVSQLPFRLAAPILIVQHIRSSEKGNLLPGILERNARMPVLDAQQDMPIRAGRIYVAPPGFHMSLAEQRVILLDTPKVRHVRPAADVLFAAAAEQYGDGVIGTILTGMGSDGSNGFRRIRDQGGHTIVQDPLEAQFPPMPANALATGCVDESLPLEQIAERLTTLVGVAPSGLPTATGGGSTGA